MPNYKPTFAASYLGCVTQAIVNNLPPLLFTVFQREYGLSLVQLTALISLNFGVQLLVDAASALFVDRIGYRAAAVISQILCVGGLLCMGLLPPLLPRPYTGLVIAFVVSAIGGGLIEVIISPIVEALPSNKKAASMSLLHSFYCWGFVLVVVLSTLFFTLAGTQSWLWLCLFWALVPLCNSFLFARVPLRPLLSQGAQRIPLRKLFSKKLFLLLMVAMVCAGASEQAMAQWASLFAERGLGVGKTMGDLLGPCVFAALMGLTRLALGSGRLNLRLETVLLASGGVCAAGYLLAVFAPGAILSLVGCGLCGLAVGAMWPSVFSLAARVIPKGGTAMYAFFALAGDAGCAGGPGLVGLISNAGSSGALQGLSSFLGDSLKTGLLFAILFPLLLLASVVAIARSTPNASGSNPA